MAWANLSDSPLLKEWRGDAFSKADAKIRYKYDKN